MTEVIKNKGFVDYQPFADDILNKTGVSMCTLAHFGRPLPSEPRKHVRFAYYGIDVDRIEESLGILKEHLGS